MNLNHLSEYRNPELCQQLVRKIHSIATRDLRLMEVCGTHTMSISRNGIRQLIPDSITLLSGPGCPVCVTSQTEIDQFIVSARLKNSISTTFGDLMRVPGSASSLQKERANGADVRVVYSTLDCLHIAEQNPDKEVIFAGVGFETTAPTIAAAVLAAQKRNISNFSVISAHKLVPPALNALMTNDAVRVDGFICPGHVSVIIGANAYQAVVDKFHVPCVIAGFEPVDILDAIYRLVQQIGTGFARVDIGYKRAVSVDGNLKAMETMFQVFEPGDAYWRGIGLIPESGLRMRDAFEKYDAISKFNLNVPEAEEPVGCACGEILSGIKSPRQCPYFATRCTPANPIGPCMVSTEGTCAAYYKYHRD